MSKNKFNDFDETISLFRYMGLTRLLDILQTKTLFFPSADMFEDPYEGSIPVLNAIARFKKTNPHSQKKITEYAQPELLSLDAFKKLARWHKISCWHSSAHESEAMWKLYGHNETNCIALCTTAGLLINSLIPYKIQPNFADENIWFGKVNYIDYDKDQLPEINDLNRFFYKRNSFRFEEEFRAVVSLRLASEFTSDTPKQGIKLNADINKLIKTIIISPLSDFDTTERLIRNTGWDGDIRKSKLSANPIF